MIYVNLVDIESEYHDIGEEMRSVVDNESEVFVGLIQYILHVYCRPLASLTVCIVFLIGNLQLIVLTAAI